MQTNLEQPPMSKGSPILVTPGTGLVGAAVMLYEQAVTCVVVLSSVLSSVTIGQGREGWPMLLRRARDKLESGPFTPAIAVGLCPESGDGTGATRAAVPAGRQVTP